MKEIRAALFLLSSILLVSCALVSSAYQAPDIELTHLQSLDRRGLDQVITVHFSIENPTNEDLNISRFSYRLDLENIEQISGVIYDLKPIHAFGKTQVQFKVTVNIFSAFRILESAIKNKDGIIGYELVTKVSSAWWKLPVVSEKSGQINLADKYNL